MPPSGSLGSLRMKRLAVLGMGNRLWGDDGAGSVLAERLKSAQPGLAVFDGGMVPENFLEKVAVTQPDSILLVDTVDFGGTPGECRILTGEDLAHTGLTTHAGSPRILASYLEQRTGAEVSLLAIQPENTAAGALLSDAVRSTVEEWVGRLREEPERS